MQNYLMKKRILLVEDDQDLADLLIRFLEDEYEIIHSVYPEDALIQVEIQDVDIILLDLSLPQMDGLVLCKKLYKLSKAKVIISSARSDINDKLNAFESGALDYLPKPYDPRELKARIKLHLPKEKDSKETFSFDEKALLLFFNQEKVTLSNAESEIFSILFRNKQQISSREQIANAMSSHNFESSLDSINVLIGRLRKKVHKITDNQITIKNIRLVGYKLESI